MNFSWKIYGLILLAVCIPHTLQSENDITDDETEIEDNYSRCKHFSEDAEEFIVKCGLSDEKDTKNVTAFEAIDQLRCLWTGLETIDMFKDFVEECEKIYPDDSKQLFCGIKVLICAVDLLVEECPSLEETEKNDAKTS